MSALMEIEVAYSAATIFKELPKTDKKVLQKAFRSIFKGDDDVQTYNHVIVDEYEATLLTKYGITFTVHQFKGSMPVALVPKEHADGKVVNVHIPNVGLLAMDQVTVIENVCTDTLQDHLDRGWRILCVCPPNSCRRPDYILGRVGRDES